MVKRHRIVPWKRGWWVGGKCNCITQALMEFVVNNCDVGSGGGALSEPGCWDQNTLDSLRQSRGGFANRKGGDYEEGVFFVAEIDGIIVCCTILVL